MKCQFSSSSWGSFNQMHVMACRCPQSHCISTANIYELFLHCVSVITLLYTVSFNDQISFGFIFGGEWWSARADPTPGCNPTCLMCLIRRPSPKVIQGGRNVDRLRKNILFSFRLLFLPFLLFCLLKLYLISLSAAHILQMLAISQMFANIRSKRPQNCFFNVLF